MRTEILNPFLEADWDRWVDEHPASSPFHGIGWARVLHGTYGHSPAYLRCVHLDQQVALVPLMEVRSRLTGRRGVSLPFSDYCDPLIFDESHRDQVMEALLDLAVQRKWKYVELRGGPSPRGACSSMAFHGHTVSLGQGLDALWGRLSSAARRGVRKAEQSGLRVRVSYDERDILAFFRLHGRTRRRHGLPPQPYRFFENIHREILAKGTGFLVVAEMDETPVSAAVFFTFGPSALYKFGASDERRQRLRGNNLVIWRGIRFLCESGCHRLHLGRTALTNQGLRRFKLAWGADEEEINYYRFNVRRRAWVHASDQTSGLHAAIFSKLPLSLNRLGGRLIYPHLH